MILTVVLSDPCKRNGRPVYPVQVHQLQVAHQLMRSQRDQIIRRFDAFYRKFPEQGDHQWHGHGARPAGIWKKRPAQAVTCPQTLYRSRCECKGFEKRKLEGDHLGRRRLIEGVRNFAKQTELPFQFAGATVVQLGNYLGENVESTDILGLQDVTLYKIHHLTYVMDTRMAALDQWGHGSPVPAAQVQASPRSITINTVFGLIFVDWCQMYQ